MKEVAPEASASRPWLLIVTLVIVAAGIGYGVYRSTTISLEETPPERPLQARELSAYLERDQIRVGAYESMMALPDDVEGWPAGASEVAAQLYGESSQWSLDRSLPREMLTADQTFAMLGARE